LAFFLHESDVTSNVVQGNFIGVSTAGTALGNKLGGVYLFFGAHDNQRRKGVKEKRGRKSVRDRFTGEKKERIKGSKE
jgi:hypothetical protein